MFNEQQTCLKLGHEGNILTRICIFKACKAVSRHMCDRCILKNTNDHLHDQEMKYLIQLDNFKQYFQVQKLPQVELRIESQFGNQAKLKYLKKIYEDFDEDQTQEISNIISIIKNLIKEYEQEKEYVQLLNNTYQQFSLSGLQSLNEEQLIILIDNQCEFINKETEYYRQLNQQLNKFYQVANSLKLTYCKPLNLGNNKDQQDQEDQEDQENYDILSQKNQKYHGLSMKLEKLRKINDYLSFQEYSNDGQIFSIDKEEFSNRSFFSKNHRYFATINERDRFGNDNKLKIRKQTTLDVAQQINTRIKVSNIKFDPQFNCCVIQKYSYEQTDYYFYILRKNKQFKLIKKFTFNFEVKDFFVSNLHNIIMFLGYSVIIQALNCINECINKIQHQYFKPVSCYGCERNIIAINDLKEIKLYYEVQNQKQPLMCMQADQNLYEMQFINYDSQLLNMNLFRMELWEIDYKTFKITQINKIEIFYPQTQPNMRTQQFISEFNIIRSKYDHDTSFLKIEILDINFKQWLRFDNFFDSNCKSIYLTKHFFIISYEKKQKGESQQLIQVIKRRQKHNYEGLEDDY